MDPGASIALAIGARVRSARTGRGWTLDELSARSGVSRRALVNVEQGASSPSVATLLKLAGALGVSLASLVEAAPDGATVVRRRAEHSILWRGEHGGEARLTASTSAPNVVELWDWTLGPGDAYASEAHDRGTLEVLHVIDGSVEVTVGGAPVRLNTGDALTFSADAEHTYANPTRRLARFALAVYEPAR